MSFEAQWLSARLNFEILNISVDAIANTMGLETKHVEEQMQEQSWKQWFPATDSEFDLDPDSDINEGENLFELKANQYTAEGRKRLQVYQIAKQLHLMSLYTRLEVSLIEKANEAIDIVDAANISAISTLSGVLQSLTRDLNQLSQSMTLGTDSESGLPQLIIRDLSGTKA